MLEKIEISNFLSIKEKQILKVSNRLTTIIGENASGKSAILKAIEKLNGITIKEKEKNINLKSEETKIIAQFCLNSEKRKKMNREYEKKYPQSLVRYSEDNKDLIYKLNLKEDGELEYSFFYKDSREKFDILSYNKTKIINAIVKCISSKEVQKKIKDKFISIKDLDDVTKIIDDEDLKQLNIEEKNNIIEIQKELKEELYLELIPDYEFIYFNSFKGLLVDEISINDMKNSRIVKNFLSAANIDMQKLVNAIEEKNMQYIKSSENQTLKFITNNFRKIFSQVKNDDEFQLSMSVDTSTKKLYFWIKNSATDTDVLKFSDESEGTQWYLSMYLRLFEYFNKNKSNKSYILLLDEPNVYLNAVAQSDLLNNVLKKNLSDMQIIYTTHSPYMIDAEDLYSLRVIHKDDETRIFNTSLEYLSYKEKTDKRKDVDVLSPVLIATGINVSNQLILDQKDVLVVVEGAHDYYVLNAMKKILNKKIKIKFIPCTSCQKIPFMSGYLVGLGYKVIALVDNDSEGRKVMKKMKKQNENGELYNVICYSKQDIEEGDCTLEELFSTNDFKEKVGEKSTPNYRKLFYGEEQIEFDPETKANFEYIFKIINDCMKK